MCVMCAHLFIKLYKYKGHGWPDLSGKKRRFSYLERQTETGATPQTGLRSKRVQRGRISVGVERRPDALCRLAVCANAPTSRLDTAFRAGHTAPTPFQILLSECVPMRILVAEDDAPLADFLRQRLVQEQFAVQLASDGTEAQRLATNQAFDLVILDLNFAGGRRAGCAAKHPLSKAGFAGDGGDDFFHGGGAGARAGRGRRRLHREAVCVCRAGRADSSSVATGKPAGKRGAYRCGSRGGPRGAHRAARGAQYRAQPKGICAAGVSHASRGTAGDADSYCRTSVETKFRYDDERGGRLHQLFAQKNGHGL